MREMQMIWSELKCRSGCFSPRGRFKVCSCSRVRKEQTQGRETETPDDIQMSRMHSHLSYSGCGPAHQALTWDRWGDAHSCLNDGRQAELLGEATALVNVLNV